MYQKMIRAVLCIEHSCRKWQGNLSYSSERRAHCGGMDCFVAGREQQQKRWARFIHTGEAGDPHHSPYFHTPGAFDSHVQAVDYLQQDEVITRQRVRRRFDFAYV